MKEIRKLAIANRGEVAVRIHRTCKKLGIKTVLLHSEPDIKTKAYRICDETVNIGPGPTQLSYLNIDAQIKAALAVGADAIHPGFGFLSENAEFAKKTIEAGLIFIGPSPEAIEQFGDKIKAKHLCKKADIPLIPGFQEANADINTLIKECTKIGYPVLVKAAAGGGGRGMRVIHSESQAESEIRSAMNEAEKSFGNSTVFLEKYLDQAKHIEVQIFGDFEGKIYVLGERECSVQRKHQKIIEETPSPSLTNTQRQTLFSYAERIGRFGNYKNAGTVEFMFQKNQFYFLEVNTRLQVEHTVTEEVFNIDLVENQILTAQNKPINFPAKLTPQGHSIELRLYAEDPYNNGVPSTGVLGTINFPKGQGRRIEVGIEKGDEITPFYDSMIAKIISTQNNRIEAITDLAHLLKNITIFGVQTNTPLLLKILNHSEFILGIMTTHFFEKYFAKALEYSTDKSAQLQIEKALNKKIESVSINHQKHSPWNEGWRPKHLYSNNKTDISQIKYEQIGHTLWWKKDLDIFKFDLLKNTNTDLTHQNKFVLAPMPGSIFKIHCKENQKVQPGDTLVILEAMKMEHNLKANTEGYINKIHFNEGDSVQDGDLIIEIEDLNEREN